LCSFFIHFLREKRRVVKLKEKLKRLELKLLRNFTKLRISLNTEMKVKDLKFRIDANGGGVVSDERVRIKNGRHVVATEGESHQI
jgi:hypothetical protein